MVPVRVRELKCATNGLPLVPPVNPPQSNRSCVALCRVVQLMQVIGASALAGYPVTRTRYRYPESMPSRLAPRTSSMFCPSCAWSTTKPTSRLGSDPLIHCGATSSRLTVQMPSGACPSR
jgi:hypothetical protein